MERSLEIFGKEFTSKKNGNTFVKYTAKIKGEYFDIRFTKECETCPRSKGKYRITFDESQVMCFDGEHYIGSDGVEYISNRAMVFKRLEKLEKIEMTEEDRQKRNQEFLKALFDE